VPEGSRIDAVLGYHTNPFTCGVAKFNSVLASRLSVPHRFIFADEAGRHRAPLISLKLAEFRPQDVHRLRAWLDVDRSGGTFSVFLHAYADTPLERRLVRGAEVVYCGNDLLYQQLRAEARRVESLWCPGTNLSREVFETTELTVFSFGMAHKVRADKYRRLRELLEQTGRSYAIYLSTALHEGTSFDDSFSGAFEELRETFGPRIYFMGYLSDQAVFNYLHQTTYFAAFFDGGVRANNTSVNTALQAGSVVITNLDRHSPPQMAHGRNVLDIEACPALPTDPAELAGIGREASRLGWGELGWDALVERLATRVATGTGGR